MTTITRYTQDGDPLIPNTEWVRSLYFQLERRITSTGVDSVSGNIVDNTDPANPVVTQVQSDWDASSGLGEILNKPDIIGTPTPITIADLQSGDTAATLGNKSYILTDGNNIGLVINAIEGKVDTQGVIQHTTFSRANVEFTDATPATSGVFKLQLDGVDFSDPITWDDTWTAIRFAGDGVWVNVGTHSPAYNVFPSGTTSSAKAYIDNIDTTNPVLTLVKVSGDDPPATVTSFAGGSVQSLKVDYDLANDVIKNYYDEKGDKINASVVNYSYTSSQAYGNDFTQDGGTTLGGYDNLAAPTYTGAVLSKFKNNNHYNDSKVTFCILSDGGSNANSFSGQYLGNNLYNNTTVDLTYTGLTAFTQNNISLSGETFTPNKDCSGLTVNLNNSDYQNDFTISSNTIDMAATPDLYWTGKVTITNTGTLNTIDGLARVPKYFSIHMAAGVDLTIALTATNIISPTGTVPYTVKGNDGDWLDCMQDGTNVYIMAIHNF